MLNVLIKNRGFSKLQSSSSTVLVLFKSPLRQESPETAQVGVRTLRNLEYVSDRYEGIFWNFIPA